MFFELGKKKFMNKFFDSLKSESDRGLVLISASFIDLCLKKLFEKYLILDDRLKKAILEDSLAPLSTFSNKIKMAFSLGLIDEQIYKNLDYIRKIRNKFAHSLFEVNFKDQQIIDWCNNIDFPRIPGFDSENYRHLFYDATFFHAGYLHSTITKIKKQTYNPDGE
jgi:DNA-binding MltR family transcriptional regulator